VRKQCGAILGRGDPIPAPGLGRVDHLHRPQLFDRSIIEIRANGRAGGIGVRVGLGGTRDDRHAQRTNQAAKRAS
jgi:hypothetical protein